MDELRLGDVIDDHCIKCRRLTNHSIVSMMEGEVAKVRCRSCYHEHTYLHEQAPPSRKELKKAELVNAAAAQTPSEGGDAQQEEPTPATAGEAPAEQKQSRGRTRKA